MWAGKLDVAVVGGGIAGMLRAISYASAGQKVAIFERNCELGGMVSGGEIWRTDAPELLRSHSLRLHAYGWRPDAPEPLLNDAGNPVLSTDLGAEAFAVPRADSPMRDLIMALGLGDKLVSPEKLGSWTVNSAGAYPLPSSGILGIPASFADAAEVLGAAGEAEFARDASLPATVGMDAESLGELVRARFGSLVLERLVAPVCRGVYSMDPDMLDDRILNPRLRERLQSEGSLAEAVMQMRKNIPPGTMVQSLAGGMQTLTQALAEVVSRLKITVLTRVFVEDVDVSRREILTDSGAYQAAKIVVTTPVEIRSAAGIVALDDYGVTTVPVVAALVKNRCLDAKPRGTGVLLGADMGDSCWAKAFTHTSAKWAWVSDAVPDGAHLCRLSYPEDRADVLAGLSHADFLSRIAADLRAITGCDIAPEDIIGFRTHTWQVPHPPARIGGKSPHSKVKSLFLSDLDSDVLEYAGTWWHGTGLDRVVGAVVDDSVLRAVTI